MAKVGGVHMSERTGPPSPEADPHPGGSPGTLAPRKGNDGDGLTKPSLSYIAMIAKVILSSPSRKLNLASIYADIEERFPYFRSRGQGWKNSVRHNLSLNDCFVKMGRCEDGKGSYWGIHPAHLADFLQGDFRQHRKASRSRHRRTGLRAGLPGALRWEGACPQCPFPAPCFAGTLSLHSPAPWGPGSVGAGERFWYGGSPWGPRGWGLPHAALGGTDDACCSLCVRPAPPLALCAWQWPPQPPKSGVYPWTPWTQPTLSKDGGVQTFH